MRVKLLDNILELLYCDKATLADDTLEVMGAVFKVRVHHTFTEVVGLATRDFSAEECKYIFDKYKDFLTKEHLKQQDENDLLKQRVVALLSGED